MARIDTLVINIINSNGEEVISPLYEVHTWEDAERIISNTRKLIAESANPENTIRFSLYGQGA